MYTIVSPDIWNVCATLPQTCEFTGFHGGENFKCSLPGLKPCTLVYRHNVVVEDLNPVDKGSMFLQSVLSPYKSKYCHIPGYQNLNTYSDYETGCDVQLKKFLDGY